MKHLDEGVLQALADGEVLPGGRRAAEAHVAGCGACAAQLAALRGNRSLLAGALARVDVAPPTAQAQMALRRRRARAGWWGAEARAALLRAAALLLVLGGAAAAAVPGSPLRAWLDGPAAAPAPAPRAPAPRVHEVAPPPPPPAAGVSILPDGGRVRVVINGAARGLRVHARMADAELVEVAASGPAASARFRTSPGRVEVVGAGAGEVRIALPRGAETAAVEVDGVVYLAKAGDRLRAVDPAARLDANGEAEFRVQR
jgi:hypothetical protein